MTLVRLGKLPIGDGVWGVVVASVLAIVLVLAYVLGPRSVIRAAFALAALAVLVRQVQVFRNRRDALRQRML
jgi:hypothetical protein